ncbi:MAG: mechanosensitive ion channel family protein [Nitrospirales bacterium]
MLDLNNQYFSTWMLMILRAVMEAGFRMLCIFLIAYLVIRLLKLGLNTFETTLIKHREQEELYPGATSKRIKTLTGLVQTIGLTAIWVIATIMALAQIGLDITPILAGAGIIGLAIGFGAQNLVRDMINGFFIILENQIRVGDVAIVNGTGGLIEHITFRTITLRDQAGVVHIFPNGTVTTMANMTKEWSAYLMDIGVAYKEDIDRVIQIMKDVGEDLQEDNAFRTLILEPIEIFGIDQFKDSEVVIKARIKTQPIKQWEVGREYRRRLKKSFDTHGIEIPFPHRTLYMGEASLPFTHRSVEAKKSA